MADSYDSEADTNTLLRHAGSRLVRTEPAEQENPVSVASSTARRRRVFAAAVGVGACLAFALYVAARAFAWRLGRPRYAANSRVARERVLLLAGGDNSSDEASNAAPARRQLLPTLPPLQLGVHPTAAATVKPSWHLFPQEPPTTTLEPAEFRATAASDEHNVTQEPGTPVTTVPGIAVTPLPSTPVTPVATTEATTMAETTTPTTTNTTTMAHLSLRATTTTTMLTTAMQCPACTPKAHVKPDLVIPFFERDLCKLTYTAKSLVVNDPEHNFGDVYLVWVSLMSSEGYKDTLTKVVETVSQSHTVHLLDFSEQITTSAHLTGWFGQQILKLKIASLVKSEYYVVMDAKNTLIQPFKPQMFFDGCNRGKIQAQFAFDKIPMPHKEWYGKSAEALHVSPPDKGYWPASITPVIFHKQTVLNMLRDIGEDSSINALCNGPLCRMLGTRTKSGHGATEFTLYTLYAYQKAELDCIHAIEKMQHFDIPYGDGWEGQMFWRMDQYDLDKSTQENISIGDKDGFPLMWHPGTDADVPQESSFPLKFDDLTKRWAASLWRGVEGNRKQLSAINLETLTDINTGWRQFPIMFGAQPASLEGMDDDRQSKCISQLLTLYQNAGLYDPATENKDDLVACVVGWKND